VENDNKNIGFRANNEEIALIDEAAAKAGMNRADYLRFKTIPTADCAAPMETKNSNLEGRLDKLEALVKHSIYVVNQVYVGLFSIAEAEGKSGRFLTIQQLDEIDAQTRAEALAYAVEFPQSFPAVQAEIAAASKKPEA
jgi:hypothetical protein